MIRILSLASMMIKISWTTCMAKLITDTAVLNSHLMVLVSQIIKSVKMMNGAMKNSQPMNKANGLKTVAMATTDFKIANGSEIKKPKKEVHEASVKIVHSPLSIDSP